MLVRIERNGQIFDIPCELCGSRFRLSDRQPELYGDDDTLKGSVCPNCFSVLESGGTSGLVTRLRDVAQHWMTEAKQREQSILSLADTLTEAKLPIVTSSDPNHFDDDPFGLCPVDPADSLEYRNVGRKHFCICMRHSVFWPMGSNLFSSWRDEDETVWQQNREMLAKMKEVEPFYCNCGDCKRLQLKADMRSPLKAETRSPETPVKTSVEVDGDIPF